MLISRLHRLKNTINETRSYSVVKQVAHRIDEDPSRSFPGDWLGKPFWAKRKIEPVLERMSRCAAEPLGKALSITIIATARDLGATSYRVPSCISPFNCGFARHLPLPPSQTELSEQLILLARTVMLARAQIRCSHSPTSIVPNNSSGVRVAGLAHEVRNPIEAGYRRSDLFERRRLMDDWSGYLADESRSPVAGLLRFPIFGINYWGRATRHLGTVDRSQRKRDQASGEAPQALRWHPHLHEQRH